MNLDNKRGTAFLEGNLNPSPANFILEEKAIKSNKTKPKNGIGVFKVKSNSQAVMGPGATYDECFSGSNFTSHYEDECPVNYSLKYSETESCKVANKCDSTKTKFKDYSDYAETDLDQPTDFSLKYAEKTYDDENKANTFDYFTTHKVKFKEYTDYVETDLDQPTDFTLKYRESAEEDIKSVDFNYYENEGRKVSSNLRVQSEETEDPSCERLPERYASQNETPLMFSRSSSMNSLSSFAHITQSIPDDRSSIVSDFSRMTSGIISPSELPDSPTQTAPSSPKRHKPAAAFSVKPDFFAKQSVFEDDVATYKQEDTPIEFSRATSLSSLNLDNPVKSELVAKRNSTSSLLLPKEENRNSGDQPQSDYLKQQITVEKAEHDKGKFELASVLEVDESLCADCISIDIQINCRKPKPSFSGLIVPQETNPQPRQSNGFSFKPNFRLRFHNDNRKGYSSYEGSDDAVHTYHTEGTPANVSHAGSHSDLSALSIASGIPSSAADENSDNESLFRELSENVTVNKAESHKSNLKEFNGSVAVKLNMNKGVHGDVYVQNQSQLDYFRKQHQLTAKDETATFATENSPCDFSITSSFNDLTVNVIEPPLNRTASCEEPPSQMLSPLHNVSPQSPNSMVFEEVEDAEKCSEGTQNDFEALMPINQTNEEEWNHSAIEEGKAEKILQKDHSNCTGTETAISSNFEFDSSQPLTPFEEALLEECIRLGMPPKKSQKQLQETNSTSSDEAVKPSEPRDGKEIPPPKSTYSRSKCLTEKKTHSNARTECCVPQSSRVVKDVPNILNACNLDFDTSEPLTPFEEVLLEQCILLGMPQKKTSRQENVEEYHMKYLNEGDENLNSDSPGLITPLETVLLEQCIRLGMPQKKNPKRGDGNVSAEESHKAIGCVTSHLNRLKLNSETEKDKDSSKKCDNCPCGKKHNNRKKNSSCKKTKNRLDHFKVESCPG